jgi:hypothetical protein
MQQTVSAQNPPASKPPVSARKASANRANAQRSTGPRTTKGKAASSLNALRHGILARAAFNVTLEGEERRAEFDALVAGLAQEYQPRTLTEHMMVQQLAGAYWKLAKVWTHETEAAWRGWVGYPMPLEEMKEYEDFGDPNMEMRIATLSEAQKKFFPEVGLGEPTISTGASARTILRYQGALNAMLFRCINFLERRRKERAQPDEAIEELDYINEPTAEPERSKAKEKSAKPGARAELHKRTQKDAADAPVSSAGKVQTENPASVAAEMASKKASRTS